MARGDGARVICAEAHPCSPRPSDLKKPGRGICRVCARKDPATARQNFDARVRELRGAGDEHAAERPVLTVAQVFELAEVMGRHPVGNVRALPTGGYRLRFSRNGGMHTYPQTFASRTDAQAALWRMTADGRADFHA